MGCNKVRNSYITTLYNKDRGSSSVSYVIKILRRFYVHEKKSHFNTNKYYSLAMTGLPGQI